MSGAAKCRKHRCESLSFFATAKKSRKETEQHPPAHDLFHMGDRRLGIWKGYEGISVCSLHTIWKVAKQWFAHGPFNRPHPVGCQ